MTDARERRRQRANESHDEGKSPLDALKAYRVPIVIGVLWLAVVGYNVAAAEGVIEVGGDGCPGHWHAGYAVYVDGEQLRFNPNGPAGDAQNTPPVGMHRSAAGWKWSVPSSPWMWNPTGDAFEKLGVDISGDELTVSAAHPQAGTYKENATHSVRVFHQEWEGTWTEVSNVGSFLGKQLGNGDRVLITYGPAGEDVSALQESVRDLEGGTYEPAAQGGGYSDDRIIGIIMATIFAGLALMIWRKFTAGLN